MHTFLFLLDLGGTALTIALLWFSLQIPVDEKVFFPMLFCSANDPRIDKGTNLAFKPLF